MAAAASILAGRCAGLPERGPRRPERLLAPDEGGLDVHPGYVARSVYSGYISGAMCILDMSLVSRAKRGQPLDGALPRAAISSSWRWPS